MELSGEVPGDLCLLEVTPKPDIIFERHLVSITGSREQPVCSFSWPSWQTLLVADLQTTAILGGGDESKVGFGLRFFPRDFLSPSTTGLLLYKILSSYQYHKVASYTAARNVTAEHVHIDYAKEQGESRLSTPQSGLSGTLCIWLKPKPCPSHLLISNATQVNLAPGFCFEVQREKDSNQYTFT